MLVIALSDKKCLYFTAKYIYSELLNRIFCDTNNDSTQKTRYQ